MLGTVAAIAAALFSYLGWVQMTHSSVKIVEEKIERHYEESGLGDRNSNYFVRPYSIRIQEDESLAYKLRRVFVPFQPVRGQTVMLLGIEKGDISSGIVDLVSKKHTQLECEMTDVGAIKIEISESRPEKVLERMAEFADLLSAVIGDPESTMSSDLDYMFEEE